MDLSYPFLFLAAEETMPPTHHRCPAADCFGVLPRERAEAPHGASSSPSLGARRPRRSHLHRVIDLAAASPAARSYLGEMVRGGGGGVRGAGEEDPVQDSHAADLRQPTTATSMTLPPEGRHPPPPSLPPRSDEVAASRQLSVLSQKFPFR